MAQLVSENSPDLIGLVALNQSIVENDVLLPGEAKEIRVGVSAALATVNDEELVQGELEAGSKVVNHGLELALGKRRQLVEERKDEGRVGGGHEHLETSDESPEVEEELVARLLNNLEEAGEDGRQEDSGESVGLDHVADEETGRLLVETIFLLEDEGIVKPGRQAEDLLDSEERENEDDRVADFAGESIRGPVEHEGTGEGPELGEDVVVDEGEVLGLVPEAVKQRENGLGAAVGLRFFELLGGYFLGENSRWLGTLENAVLSEGEE